jgi:HAD superfamily hydrolase (TIGR01509 family)
MLLVFDCDGVIVDSEIIAAAVEAELLTKAGYPIAAPELIRRFAGLTSREVAQAVETESGRPLPETFLAEVSREIDHRLGRDLKAVPGIHEVLDRLEGPRCVCSNSSAARLAISLKKTELYDRFVPHIYSAVEVGTREPKPSPNVYRFAIAAFGVAPREVLVIEDSVYGVEAARGAGARVVGFTGGAHTWSGHADALTTAGAETVIRRLADLPALVAAMPGWEGLD